MKLSIYHTYLITTLTLIMNLHTGLSQNPHIKKGNNNTTILSEEKTIDQAKIIKDWQRRGQIIKDLELKLEKATKALEESTKSREKALNEILALNEHLRNLTEKENNISDTQLKKEKNKWSGLHLYITTGIERFKLDRTNFSLNLRYELKRWEVGIVGGTLFDTNEFTYQARLSYKIF